MKLKNLLLVLIFGLLIGFNLSSQQYLDINYPGRTSPSPATASVSLYACESTPTNYNIVIDNISPFKLANLSFTFILPSGINYSSGSFVGPTGSTVSSSSADSVVITLDTLNSQQVINLNISLTAGCGVYNFASAGGTFNVGFRTKFTQVSNSLVRNNYHTFSPLIVNYPILQLVEKSFVAGTGITYNLSAPSVGDTVDREIKIKNGGTSRIDSVYFSSQYKSSILVASYPAVSSPKPPVTIVGPNRTQLITLDGSDFTKVGNTDNFLDPGEEIIFRERVVIKDCRNTVTHFTASWGCNVTMCQNETVENRIIFPSSSPRLQVTSVVDTNNCYGIPPSGAQRMRLDIFNYATNPIDSAQNIFIDIYQGNNGFSRFFSSVIDTSSIRLRSITSGGAVPYSIVSIDSNSVDYCTAAGTNSAGRYILKIDKIHAGELLRLTWRVLTCVNTRCTNGNLSVYDWGFNVSYQNRCEYTYRITNGIGMTDKDMRHHMTSGTTIAQVNSASGLTAFEFGITNSYFGFPKDPTTDYLRYEITKPACMDFVSSPSNIYIQRSDSTFLYPASGSIIVTGNKIFVRFPSGFYNLTQGKLVIKMTPNCTSCTPGSNDEIKVESFYSASSCSIGEFSLGCATSKLSIICTTGGKYFGVNFSKGNTEFVREQVSFGLQDYDNDGLPDGATPVVATAARVNRKIATYGDVVKLQLNSPVYGTSGSDKPLTFNKFVYYYAKIDNGDLLNFDSLRVSYEYGYFDISTFSTVTKSVTDTALPHTLITRNAGGDSVEYIFKFNIDSLRSQGYFPRNTPLITNGFSFFDFKAYYHVDKNPGLTIKTLGVDYIAFPDTADITATSGSIDSRRVPNFKFYVRDKIEVIGFDYNSHWNTFNTFNSCDSIQVNERFRFNTGTWILGNPATNYFKNEYRNFSYLDTLKIATSKSYNIIGARMTYYRTNGTLSLATSSVVNVLPIMTGSGNSYNFDLKSLFKSPFDASPASALKPFVFGDEGYMADITLTFEPNCQNQGGLDTINYTWIAKTDSLSPTLANCNTPPVAIGKDRLEYVAPQPTLQPTIQLVRVDGKKAIWEVLVSNTSISYAKNVWFGFSNPTTTLTVNSVSRISSGSANNMRAVDGSTILNGVINPISGIYIINDLAGGKDIKFRIEATIDSNNCDIDSLIYTLSYNCVGYPTSITTYSCPAHRLALYAQPMLPTLFNSISTVKDTIQLCDTAEYIFKIENTNVGRAYNVFGSIYLQQFLNFVPGSALVYDNATSTWVPITPVPGVSGQFSFDVSNTLTATLSNGLPGLGVDTANKIFIKFKATPECNYTSGSKVEVSSKAKAACGYQFESLPTFGTALHITGATPSHRNKVIINSDFLSPCFDSTDVNVKIVNLGPINTWVGDSITVALPRGVKYAGGSYAAVSNVTLSAPSITSFGGRDYLSWTLLNLNANIDTAEFDFKIYSLPDSIKTCDANYIYAYTTTQDSVVCSSTGVPCNVKIISGDTTEAIFTYKATLNLSNPIATSTPNPPSGERVAISFDITNFGQTINSSIAGNPINTTISIYRDSDNNGVFSSSDVFIKNQSKNIVVPQGLSTYFDTIDLDAGDACDFIVVIDFDENSCVCNTASIYFTTTTLIIDEPNDTVCENQSDLIGYENPITGYSYTWSVGSANSSLSYLSSDSVPNPTFTAPSITSSFDSMVYYVQVERMGCISYDTLSVYIIKMPEAIAYGDTTVCYDSAILRGNTVLSSPIYGTINTYWTIDSTFGNGFAGVLINNVNSPNTIVRGLTSGSYKFIWNVDNGKCLVNSDTILVNVINPIFTAGNDTILCNTTRYQLQGSVTSPGFNLAWSILPSSPSGSILSNANNITPLISNLSDGIYSLVLTLSGPGCDFTDTVIIEVNQPLPVNAGVDSSFCGTTTFNLWATPVNARRFGVWSVDSSQVNYTNISFINDSLANTIVSFTTGGNYTLIWNSIHPVCGTISDTVLINITDPVSINAGRDTSLCEATSLKLYADTILRSEIGYWTQLSGPTTVVFADSSDNDSTISGLAYGRYKLLWIVDNGICDSVTDTLTIFVDSLPVANAGIDDTLCISDTAIFTLGSSPSLLGHSGTWSQISGNPVSILSVNSASSSISGLSVGVYEFVWSVSNGICPPVPDTVVITVFDNEKSDAGQNDTICISDTAGYSLTATVVTSPASGVWRQVSGPTATIINTISPTSGLSGLSVGVYEFEWSVSNGVCPPVLDTVSITVLGFPSVNAGLDDSICVSSYTLNATAVSSPITGRWSQLSGAPSVISNPTLANSTITGLSMGIYEYIWTVDNGICQPISDTVFIHVFGTVNSNAGQNDTICISDTAGYTLSSIPVALPARGIWKQISGPIATIADTTFAISGLSGLSVGVYQFEWNVSNGVCPATMDTVTITVFASPTANAGMDDTICSSNTVGFRLNATSVSSPNSGVWTQLSGAASVITNPTLANSVITGLTTGVYEYIWTVGNGICPPVSDTVRITVFGLTTSNAGSNDTICITNTAGYSLAATPVANPATGTWRQISGAAAAIANTTSATTGLSGLAVGVYQFEWNVSNGVCPATMDTVAITVFATPTANAGIDDTICLSTYTLGANIVASPNSGVWTQYSGAASIISNPTSPTSGISGLTTGVYEYIWTVGNGICPPESDTVRITVFGLTTSNAGADDTICVTNTAGYSLAATAVANPATGTWRQISGAAATIANTTSATTGLWGLSVGVYQFEWNVSNGVCPATMDTVTITVFATPTANAGMDDTICSSNTLGFRLNATSVSSPNSGVWTQLSGAASGITNPTLANSVITGLTVGVYEYIWTVDNGVCNSVSDTVEITVFDVPVPNAGINDSICISIASTYTLLASPVVSPVSGRWTQVSGAIVGFANMNSPTSGVTGLAVGVYQFEWSVSNGVCPEEKDTVEITVFAVPVANAGADTQTCSPVAISLNGNTPRSNETGTWTNATTNPSVATFTNANSTNPTIGNLVYGTYEFIWSVDNGICATVTDTMILKIDSISKPFAGLDDTICASAQYGLNADPVTGIDIGTWTQISGPNTPTISNINDPKSNLTGLIIGDYSFVWTVSNVTCPSVSDTVNISVMEQSIAIAGKDQVICDTSLFTALTSGWIPIKNYHTYTWSFDATNSSASTVPVITSPNSPTTDLRNLGVGIYKFVLGISNGGYCPDATDTVSVEILGKPIVDFSANNTSFCLGECTNFFNNTTIADSSGSTINQFFWSFGDGSFSTASDPTHCYDKIGSYDVRLIVSTNMGCIDSAVKSAYIQINPLPLAGFDIESTDIIPGSQVIFTDKSLGARDYEYEFGDGSTSFDQNPIYNYANEGIYTVQQIVINEFGCRDTAERTVTVTESTKVFVPSAFTPNNDGDNDEFIPVMRKVDSKNYSFKIFNRWGELLFETSDIAEGWDGTHQGVKAPTGTYVWMITYKEESGFKVEKKTGHVNLLK